VAVLKIARFWPLSKRRPDDVAVVSIEDSLGLDTFGSEAAPKAVARPFSPAALGGKRPRWAFGTTEKTIVASVLATVAVGLGIYDYRVHPWPWPWTPSPGSVTFDTVPSGVEIFVRQQSVGRSPITVALAPGTYDVRLGAGPAARPLQVAVTAGASIVEHYELSAAPAPAAATTGALRIQTEPAGLVVLVDGVDKGASPITLEQISAGDHDVVVRAGQGALKRAVHVAAGEATAVFISAAPKADAAAITAGWLSVKSSIALQVSEGGRLVGSSEIASVMLASGEHDLDFSNEAFGYHAKRRVKIAAGKTTVQAVELPNGTVSLNALPWAEVSVDGKHLGQTPIGNVSLPIGPHEVVFRHPDLGERKETVNVTLLSTARLGVDLRK
jgi:hypothetical protein